MKTINILQKLSVIGIFILITVYLVNAQNEIQVVACLNTSTLNAKDKTVNLNTNIADRKREAAIELDKISNNLFEKLGLKFDVKKTISQTSIENERIESTINDISQEEVNSYFQDSGLRFDVSKTNSVMDEKQELNKMDASPNEQETSINKKYILFDVDKTITVSELQNSFAK